MRILTLVVLLLSFSSCKKAQKENNTLEKKAEVRIKVVTPNKNLKTIDTTLIVLDSTTNLIWMKNDFSAIEKRFLNKWNEVFEWQEKMNSDNYAGFNDWRVPSIKEYRSINKNKKDRINYKQLFTEIDSTFFWGKGAYAFWSSTTPNKNTASYMSFKEGFAVSGNREKITTYTKEHRGKSFGISVRLVRNNNEVKNLQ
ncbi:Lcl C-terminal domain-containing protein [Tenacibaculum singaporense]|uniref:Lcl C-terminal domain-containing protein n=1 Tax=Tenacibaculum singaporense TaxID=2358479 RepID=UPI000F685F57|nr:DUF1566 domain-containing protein [Tenacibaculum singaporense]RSC93901.1 DUF1566 domain-containing protein [Tenacibaculum singaporense]